MPFFTSKFSPKKVPSRRSDVSVISKELGADFAARELGLEVPRVKLTLGENDLVFEDGQWISESGVSGSAHKENTKLRKTVKTLEEENNMLKLKFEILLDMLTQTTAESQMQLKEIEELKKSLGNRNKKI